MDDGLQALEDVLVPVLVELGINCVEAGAWCRETFVVCCELRVLERWWPYAYSALCLLVESNAKSIIAGLRGRGNAGWGVNANRGEYPVLPNEYASLTLARWSGLIEQLGAGATASAINAVCFGVFAEDRRSKPTDAFADFCMRMLLRHVPVCAGVSGCVVGNYSILAATQAEAALEGSTVECVANPHLSNTINRANGIVPPDTAKRLMDCTVFELKDNGGVRGLLCVW